MKEDVHMFLEKSIYLREKAARRYLKGWILDKAVKKKQARELAQKKKMEAERKLQDEIKTKRENGLRKSERAEPDPAPEVRSKFTARNLKDTMHFKVSTC